MSTKVTKKSSWPKVLLIVGGSLLIIALILFGGFFFKKYNDLKKNPPSADQAAQAQIDRYLEEVGKLYALPKNEKPSVATVKDKSKLKDQPFFNNAENGDVTLIYTNAKLAILYRPSTKKLINVSTVNLQSEAASIKIIGDQVARDAAEKTIQAAYKDQVSIKEKSDAKGTPTGVTVVDLSGTHGQLAAQVAASLKGVVGNLPAGEDKPDGVDILVVTGPVVP